MAKLKIQGALVGVDFTQAGEFIDADGKKIKYGNSVKLKTSVPVEIVKNDIRTKTVRQVVIKLDSDDVATDVMRYNQQIGKELEVNIIPQEGQTFQTYDKVVFK